MSLEEDFKKSGLTARDYVIQIWDETELSGDMFKHVDPEALDAEDVKSAVLDAIEENSSATPVRKDFYKVRLYKWVKRDDGGALARYCVDVGNLNGDEGAKREILASLFTRVLRGDLEEPHREIEKVSYVLSQPRVDPWRVSCGKLFRLVCD